MREELVSIVVPVYNVAEYLPRCLESLLRQTHRQLEIILVNDGSQDESGSICEAYGQRDPRIHVFHKENGGLADARNYGLRQITGAYVTFVDSDDYVADTYVEYLYRMLKREKAQVAVCGYRETTREDGEASGSEAGVVTNGKEAVRNLFYQKGLTTSACAKLYLSSLFQGICFPKGLLYEDVNTIYKVLLQAERVAISRRVEYFYFLRPQSIVRSGFQQRKMDYIANMQEVLEDIRKRCPELLPAAHSRFLWACLHILVQLPEQGWEAERARVLDYIRAGRGAALRDPKVRLSNKLLLLAAGRQGTLVRWV